MLMRRRTVNDMKVTLEVHVVMAMLLATHMTMVIHRPWLRSVTACARRMAWRKTMASVLAIQLAAPVSQAGRFE